MQTVVGHLQRMRGKLQNRRHGEAGNQSEFHKSSNSVRQPRYQSVCSALSHSPSRARNHRASLSTSTRLIPYQPFLCASKPSVAEMANEYPCAPPGQRSNGRSGYNNRSTGYGKGQGGYNGAKGGRAQNSGNNGPCTVPYANTSVSFSSNPLASWGQKYGRSTQPPPQVYMPSAPVPWTPPATFHPLYSGMQSQNASAGHFVPPHIAGRTIPPVKTSIATAPPAITTLMAATTSSMSTKGGGKSGGPATNDSAPDTRDMSGTKTTTPGNALTSSSGTNEIAPDASHIHAPVPKRIRKFPNSIELTDAAPLSHSVIREFVPHEGKKSAMDEPHATPDATVKLLGHEALMQLQIFNITLARTLQGSLKDAKAAREIQEAAFVKKRSILLSLLQAARESERGHIRTIQRLQERFYSKMQEACKLNGKAKETAQTAATTQLKGVGEFSRMASEQREKIDDYRNELNNLDNARAISRNSYSDAVHTVLMQALGDEAVKKRTTGLGDNTTFSGAVQANVMAKKSPMSIHRTLDDRKDSGATALPQMAQLSKQQPVFERQPETGHQSIGEVLHRTTVSDAQPVNIGNDKPPKNSGPQTVSPKSQFAVSPTTVKNAIAVTMSEVPEGFWIPEKLRDLTPKVDTKKDNTKGDIKDDTKKDIKKDDSAGKVPPKQETYANKAKDKAASDSKVSSQPAAAKPQGNDKPEGPIAVKAESNQPGYQGSGRKKWKTKKKNGNGGAGGANGGAGDGNGTNGDARGGNNGSCGAVGGSGGSDRKDKGANAKVTATPKAGSAAGEMRKGG
jgi:hypothetical protein